MTEHEKVKSQLIASWTQVAALLIAIGTVAAYTGRKDQQLATTSEQVKELSSIVSEIAKAQVGFHLTETQIQERLRELGSRLEKLERSR